MFRFGGGDARAGRMTRRENRRFENTRCDTKHEGGLMVKVVYAINHGGIELGVASVVIGCIAGIEEVWW